MNAQTDLSLKNFNTFGIDVKAKQFIEIQSIDELRHVLKRFYTEEIFVLGGGSNMLLTDDIDKTVIYIHTKGISIVKEDEENIVIEVQAGENWHDLVMWTVNNGYGGLENLALIPGHVGTAPIQNIGAYGIELKDTFVSCNAIHRQTLDEKVFNLEDCKFGYRQSVFKSELRNQYIITSVCFNLTKKNHEIHTEYGAIKAELAKMHISKPGPAEVAKAVITIRQSKLPNPKEIGNSGSFFKNPIIPKTQYESLKNEFPEMPNYPVDHKHVKVPAGWLVEHSGLKGYRDGDAGVHKKQALVLVNYGNATGQDVLALSKKVQQTVRDKFGIALETEVNVF
jgi:UDP-N-acetylmuramate dehydrogenase